MSGDMSVFKKMKERITDEVNSATNKLQNMQIIDQLASSIGQQIKNDMPPNQLLPEPREHSSTKISKNQQFSLMEDSPLGGCNEDDELNSDFSPQQQLFNENTIRRLNSSASAPSMGTSGFVSGKPGRPLDADNGEFDNQHQSVINIDELSSDLEDSIELNIDFDKRDDSLDVEIDLLSDRSILNQNGYDKPPKDPASNYLSIYKAKYKSIVHAYRTLHRQLESQKSHSKENRQEFLKQITALKTELDKLKQTSAAQHDSLLSVSSSTSENDKGSPQLTTKSSTKLKDLERLLAKCKESLKQKNSLIQRLKESVSEVEKFKDFAHGLKREMAELRDAHETWTLSIAENKRVMHQEIESKNAEMEKLRAENNDLQLKLADSNGRIRQLKSAIQDLESRLVSTSAAHQKERESLTKELTTAKNNAIRQIQKEHDHNMERVKLDLEKSIESLKSEILSKDEQLIKNAEGFQQELHELNTRLDLMNTANDDQEKVIKSLESERDALSESYNSVKSEFDELSKKNDSLMRVINENESDMQTHQDQLDQLTKVEHELDALKKEHSSVLESFNQLKIELSERNADLVQLKTQNAELENRSTQFKAELDNTCKINDELKKEVDSVKSLKEDLCKQRKELDEQIVVKILTAIKNLETPTTSPGSDKSYSSICQNSSGTDEPKASPNLVSLMDELSSLALDRSNAYMTASQRLQAVLLENSRMCEELRRLKEELNDLNREKNMENQCSIDELEKLRTENEALIHDQHSYDDRIEKLENELKSYQNQVSTNDHTYQLKALQRVLTQYQEENQRLKENQKRLTAQINKDQEPGNVPDSTEFEYLKNIVYQFMLGKEPLVLARVISAVFKFDHAQVEQICKIQEAVQSALKQSI